MTLEFVAKGGCLCLRPEVDMKKARPVPMSLMLVALCGTTTPAAALIQEDASAMLTAARYGRLDAVEGWLDRGVDLSATAPGGQTALMLAAGGGHLAVVKLLLDRGADPNAWDDDEDTALGAYAAANGHHEVVKLLLDRGASPLAANRDGMNPLMFAALYGYLDAMQLLEDAMLPLAAAQSLSDLAEVLSRVGREVDADRIESRAVAIRAAVSGMEVPEIERGNPPLLMLAGHAGRCIDLGFPRLAKCVRVSGCRYTAVGRVQVTWTGRGTDEKDIVERFIREVRRLDADAVIDVRVTLEPSLGRMRMSRIEGDAISFTDARCKEMARKG